MNTICTRCGHPLPEMSAEERKLFLAGRGAVAQHPPGQCPDEIAARRMAMVDAPAARTFEARVHIVETTGGAEELVVGFVAAASAATAAEALAPLGPLANGLGVRWQSAAEHIALADVPLADGVPGGRPTDPIVVEQP